VLEGSVHNNGNRIRVTAQLIYAQDSAHLWVKRKRYAKGRIDIVLIFGP
jgi:TolB-like protein